ncbi:hypothetical protein OCJ35_09635 [Pluralibacter gergoviae]|uniref:hypothetical protein n=1 Tax=Pluralibacter gergoviae TaxID=61647 RepID=UPI000FD836CB|nr:hypothetical protein [Pluralibacter gergoviae]MCK1067291.1 hypothetical protein [Pluralibacter gergoviae]MCV7758366.1 hypothetical protein [Pluralibacter gergoviae]HDS1239209.1 hypothetical protein [Pluralibacter gergoviae]HDS1244639.1 hypothetical protein [Pluralibacter gergoviae]HDS1250043.1 hypothetical protein [Pluralibacter gergoviae]
MRAAPDSVVVENNALLVMMVSPPPVAGQTTPQMEVNAVIAQKLDAAVKEFGSDIIKQCLSGGSCPIAAQIAILVIKATMTHEVNSSGDNSSKPNLGKDHSDADKAEFGGAGSGTPGSRGPDDEEKGRNQANVEAAKKGVEQLGYDSNKVSHIFADKHHMNNLIKQFASPEATLKEMHKAVQSVAKEPGAYQTGSWVTVRVGNSNVSVKEVVINGEFRISPAPMRPF